MRLEYQILIAVAIDLLLGDPQWLPHPVRAIGRLAISLESLFRRIFGSTRLAGLLTAISTYLVVGTMAWGAIYLAAILHPLAADLVSIYIIYTTVAARDLARHSMAVFRSLAVGDIVEARRRVGAIVGRDTDQLDEAGVVRAAVESVAESTVDGVTAPLLFAVVAGPVGAIVYRSINTLDSMFGHRDDRYRQFGWAAARIDDAANYIPARCTGPLMCIAAIILRPRNLPSAPCPPLSSNPQSLIPNPSVTSPHPNPLPKGEGTIRRALKTMLRDGRKHTSPNAGLTEAAMAGALGVQLGGVNVYDGLPLEKPAIGKPLVPLGPRHIRQANALMFVTSSLFLAICLALRVGILHFWQTWRTIT
jgi:adenosylcobinamide-phosphate synthase